MSNEMQENIKEINKLENIKSQYIRKEILKYISYRKLLEILNIIKTCKIN